MWFGHDAIRSIPSTDDAVAVVGEAADHRQAGDPAGALQLDTRDVAQQARGVAGRRAQGPQCFFLHLARRRNGLQAGVLDDHRFELRGLLAAGCCHPVGGGSRHHAACAEHGDRRGHLIDLEFHVLHLSRPCC
jgi:hypothetical protein